MLNIAFVTPLYAGTITNPPEAEPTEKDLTFPHDRTDESHRQRAAARQGVGGKGAGPWMRPTIYRTAMQSRPLAWIRRGEAGGNRRPIRGAAGCRHGVGNSVHHTLHQEGRFGAQYIT